MRASYSPVLLAVGAEDGVPASERASATDQDGMRVETLHRRAPFRFAFLSAFSVPRQRPPALRTQALLPEIR